MTDCGEPEASRQADSATKPPTASEIRNWLISEIAEITGIEAQAIDPQKSFTSFGLVSRDAIVLSGDLESWLGRQLSPTLLYDYANIWSLAQHLSGETAESGPEPSFSQEVARDAGGAEPIAIIGLGCRFPGADDLESFWRLMREGIDAITEVPAERWDRNAFYDSAAGTPGKMNTRWGGFLGQVDRFDPQFFGIAPREAERMDPQQRLLLEVTWEALENAGLIPESLRGAQAGVFIGISTFDYGRLQMDDPLRLDAYVGTGNAMSIAANRLSYFFDLRGPSISVDTACSSSLVAAHLACQSLRLGECESAVVGGVNLILSPHLNITFSQARMMAADGRCKTFDAAADGYVRGEGCGVVVLKRLSDALRDGNRVLALIRGSAINQDGYSNGLTAPNGPAQEAVIRQALRQAGVEPARIGYVEAHGTGTSLGDPIEFDALKAALAPGRPLDRPCVVGSVKTNIGHLEAAAGIAGLIKATLSLQHGEIPPLLHFKTLNPQISLTETPFAVPTRIMDWPTGEERRLAGVSSFGFGGTNAHVILEEAPAPARTMQRFERPLHLFTASARDEDGLRDQARRYAAFLSARPEIPIADVCHTANAGRTHFSHRLAVIAGSIGQLSEQLAAFTAGGQAEETSAASVTSRDGHRVAFLFTGQGSHYIGMGRQLYLTQPTFRQALDRCDELLRGRLEQPLLSVLYPAPGTDTPLDQTAYTQPALFALEYALAELWRSWGIEPAAVMGHSVGEYVGACLAGVFSLEDGLRLIAARARLMQALPRNGMMASVFAPRERIAAAMADYPKDISIAAVNGPDNLAISGERRAVEAVLARLKRDGIRAEELAVSHAFHSPLMDPVLKEFERIASRIEFAAPRLDLVSNLTGRIFGPGEIPDAAYWSRHLRQTVQFAAGMESLRRAGYEIFVEVGPKATLLGMGRRCLSDEAGQWLPSLRKGQDEWRQMLKSLGSLYLRGMEVNWTGFDRDYSPRMASLPTYPFQRRRYWSESRRHIASAAEPEGKEQSPTRASSNGHERTIAEAYADPARSNGFSNSDPDFAADWLYQLAWRPQPRPTVQEQASYEGAWLIFADGGEFGMRLAALLMSRGAHCSMVFPGTARESLSRNSFRIDPARPEDFQWLLDQIRESGGPPLRGAIHLWGVADAAPEEMTLDGLKRAQVLGTGSALHLVQALARAEWLRQPRLWLATRGAQPVDSALSARSIAQSPLWGLGRVISLEWPDLRCVTVDLDPSNPPNEPDEVDAFALELPAGGEEDQVAFRRRRRYVARLDRARSPIAQPQPEAFFRPEKLFREDGTYLITGGAGALGSTVARWMASRGARHLLLAGRREPAQTIRRELERHGAKVVIARADISRPEDVSRLLAEDAKPLPPLRGVLHAAGVLEDKMLPHQDWQSLARVMAPKVEGAWNLHLMTQGRDLDCFVLFSSAAAILGSPGQANYAAANAFLDSLAHYRRARGAAALSVNWGPWAGAGMAAEAGIGQRLNALGMGSIEPEQGLQILERALIRGETQVAVLPIDWPRFFPVLGAKPSLSEIINEQRWAVPKEMKLPPEEPELRRRLKLALPAERRRILSLHIQDLVIKVLGLDPAQAPDPRQPLRELGIDSLMAIEIGNALGRALGRPLSVALIFEYPTIEGLAAHLANADCIEQGSAKPSPASQADPLGEILARLESLSEDEAGALLKKAAPKHQSRGEKSR